MTLEADREAQSLLAPQRSLPAFRIPILTSSVFGSIVFAFAAIPLWYLLGLDQFIWPFLFVFLALRLLLNSVPRGRNIILPPVARLALAFLGVQLFSGLFIIESDLYIVFARNLSIWLGGIMLMILLVNVLRTQRQLSSLLWVWVLVMTIANIAGITAFVLGDGFEFRTLILNILPGDMRTGITAETVWTRSFLAEPVPIQGLTWLRARSLFLYANTFAGALILVIPVTLYLARLYRRFGLTWWFLQIVVALSILNLLITTSRGGIFGLAAGLGAAVIYKTRPHDRRLWIAFIALCTSVLLAFILFDLSVVLEPIETFTEAKGRSHITRLNILKYSLISWAERPVFGWGTPRDMSLYGFGPAYPRLGSHSQFLSMLYRHGVVGLAFYLLFVVYLFSSFKNIPAGGWRDLLKPFLLASVVSNLVQSIFTQIDVDVMMLYFLWGVWGIVTALPHTSTSAELVGRGNRTDPS